MIYYVLFKETNKVSYLEIEEEVNLADILEGIDESIEVYEGCSNTGLYGLVYSNC